MSFYLFVFLLGVFGQEIARGNSSFRENFYTYDGDFWELKDDSMHCAEEECALALKENVQYGTTPAIAGIASAGYELRLLLKDNCQRTTMPCCRKERCYIFTTGIISSKNVYGYGSYAFIGTSARKDKKPMCGSDMAYHGTDMVNDDANATTAIECRSACQDDPKCEFWDFGDNYCRLRPNSIDTFWGLTHSKGYTYGAKNCLFSRNTKMQVTVRSCFGLKKRENEIMYCFGSEDPHTVELIVIRGETKYHKKISLGFDSSVHTGTYRIEWQWETIQFVINSHVKKTLIGPHVIPKEPLHIKVLLLPTGPIGIEQKKHPNIIFALKTVHIHHRRFITTGPQSKDEMLFFHPPKQVFGPITKLMMGLVFLIGSMCCLFFYLKRHSTTTNGYEIFINERL